MPFSTHSVCTFIIEQSKIKPIVQSSYVCTRLDMCMIACRRMHACQECTRKIWIACILVCMQVVSQRQWHKLYEHVHVLKCDSPYDVRPNPAKEFLHLAVLTALILYKCTYIYVYIIHSTSVPFDLRCPICLYHLY